MKKMLAALCAASISLAAAGCTSTDIAATSAGIQAACSAAVVGTTIYVNVESSLGGNTAQKISQVVSSATSTACNSLSAAVQAAVQTITSAGGTATVTVSTATPAPAAAAKMSEKRRVMAKVEFKATPTGVEATYIIKPDLPIPFLGDL